LISEITVNVDALIAAIDRSKERVAEAALAAAIDMAEVGVNNVRDQVPPHIVTGQWINSMFGIAKSEGEGKAKVIIGSPGAFSSNGFDYGELQEAINHPIEIGVHQSLPEWEDIWHRYISEALSEE
jgi:hypothetical protein